jgi:hypothetical protein
MLHLEVFLHFTRLEVGFVGSDLCKLFTKTGSYGSRLREDFIPKRDGLVQRLKGTLTGKPVSALPEFVRVRSY